MSTWAPESQVSFLLLPRSPSALSAHFPGRVPNPTKIDYRKKVGTMILTSLLEDLVLETVFQPKIRERSKVDMIPDRKRGKGVWTTFYLDCP